MTGLDWGALAACKNAEDPDRFFPPEEEEPDWRDLASCTEVDPEAFFPEKGGSTRAAKKMCAGCAVRAFCLEFALENDERFGVWGGMSERERRQIRAERGLPIRPTGPADDAKICTGPCGQLRPLSPRSSSRFSTSRATSSCAAGLRRST